MTVIEVGNTQTKIAVFEGDVLMGVERFDNGNIEAAIDALAALPSLPNVLAASGSVAPQLTQILAQTEGFTRLEKGHTYGVRMNYATPQTLGIDRLANAAQAIEHFGNGAALVVDMGTCVTYDLVMDGCYEGGAIAPGLRMRGKAMAAFTSALPDVNLADQTPLVGRSTTESLQSGMLIGWRAEITGFVEEFAQRCDNLQIVYTGGDLPHFEAGIKSPIFADPFWTLRGYKALYRRHAN